MATFSELEAALAAAPNIIATHTNKTPVQMDRGPDGIYLAQITYLAKSGNVAKSVAVTAVVKDFGLPGEEAWWYDRLPEPLRTVEVPVFFKDRTVSSITAAQIETFCNATWKAISGQAGAPDLRQFNVVPVDGKTVYAEMQTNTGAVGAKWIAKKFFIRLVDPNGSVAVGNANIKFEELA